MSTINSPVSTVSVSQTTPGTTNAVSVADIGATAVVTGGVNGSLGVGGVAASGTAIASAGNPTNNGAQARSSEQTATSNAQLVSLVTDLVGKLIISPYANRENYTFGTASATGTSSTSVIASPGASLKLYPTSISISNSSATAVTVAIQNGSGGTTLATYEVPAGGGSNVTMPTPMTGMSAATGIFFASSGSASTIYVNIGAYIGY